MQTCRQCNKILSGNTHYLSVCVWWLLFEEKNGKVCKRDLLIDHHHKHFTKLTYIAYYPVQWSVCRSPFQLPFCSVLYQRNFHFCTEKLCFAISISEQSSTNFLVNSARKTQCNKHTVQWTHSAMRSLRSPEFTATFSNLSSRQWRRMHDGEMKQILEIRISQHANSIYRGKDTKYLMWLVKACWMTWSHWIACSTDHRLPEILVPKVNSCSKELV